MKNANQIRQLLIDHCKECLLLSKQRLDYIEPDACSTNKCRIIHALALLPCETCNGTKQVPTPQSAGFSPENKIMDTCPDCQKPKRECKNNKACTRYMDGTCEDCPDYK